MILSVDTETTGVDFVHGCRPWLVTMCDGTYSYHWSASVANDRTVQWKSNDIEAIKDMLDRASILIFHNAEFDIRALISMGIDYTPYYKKTHDTMVAHHTIDSSSKKGLKYLTTKYLLIPDDDETYLQNLVVQARKETPVQIARKGHKHFPAMKASWKQDMFLCPKEALVYALRDAERTWLYWFFIKKELLQYDLFDVYKTRMAYLPALMSMHYFGIHVYTDKLQAEIDSLEERNKTIVDRMMVVAGLNWRPNLNKATDLHTLFHVHLKLPEYLTDSGQYKFDESVFLLYAHYNEPLVDMYCEWNNNNTRINYLSQYMLWSKDDRIHPIYDLAGTKQTRQSSKNPNAQNIGKNLKDFFGPPPGKIWLDIDCVNIELRIWAYSVGSQQLIDRFEAGESVHAMITRIVYPEFKDALESTVKAANEYNLCKAGNFARIYGAGDDKANKTYGKRNAVYLIDKEFPEISAFTKKCMKKATDNKEVFGEPCIFTLTGYKVNVPDGKLYKAVNAFIQGTAGDIMGQMMIDCHKAGYPMFQQVHDALKFELDETEKYLIPDILKTMQSAGERIIPTCHLDYKIVESTNVPF